MKKYFIYEILNIENEKRYVGRTCNVLNRFNYHKKTLNNNKHHNHILQKDWNDYGESFFKFNILLECNEENVYTIEQNFIDSNNYKYNVSKYSNKVVKKKYDEIQISDRMKKIKNNWDIQYNKYIRNKNIRWSKYKDN